MTTKTVFGYTSCHIYRKVLHDRQKQHVNAVQQLLNILEEDRETINKLLNSLNACIRGIPRYSFLQNFLINTCNKFYKFLKLALNSKEKPRWRQIGFVLRKPTENTRISLRRIAEGIRKDVQRPLETDMKEIGLAWCELENKFQGREQWRNLQSLYPICLWAQQGYSSCHKMFLYTVYTPIFCHDVRKKKPIMYGRDNPVIPDTGLIRTVFPLMITS